MPTKSRNNPPGPKPLTREPLKKSADTEIGNQRTTMKRTHYDLVILGSGSTAFAAALCAQEFGKTAVMTEERTIGGTCVNRGCLPSKNLIGAAKIIHHARNPRFPGLTPTLPGLH